MSTSIPIMFMACGSFSPPTPMHLRMFEIARDHFHQIGKRVLGGIISPVHDSYAKKGLESSTHRINMVNLALQTSDWIRVSDYECRQNKWTPTRVSLQYHQNYVNSLLNDYNSIKNNSELPGWLPDNISKESTDQNVQVKLLCGADLLESFSVPGLWKDSDIEAILGEHGIIVISRSGNDPEKFIFESDMLTKYKHNITIVKNWIANEVSSTMARRFLSRGLSVKYLLDDTVVNYIRENELYGITESPIDTLTKSIYPTSDHINELCQIIGIDKPDLIDRNSIIITSSRSDTTVMLDNHLSNGSVVKRTVKGHPIQPGHVVKISPNRSIDVTDTKNNEVGLRSDKLTADLKAIAPSANRYNPSPIRNSKRNNCTSLKKRVEFFSDNHLEQIGFGRDFRFTGRDRSKRYHAISDDDREMIKDRNDLIKFVFTSHGIRVISEKGYVV